LVTSVNNIISAANRTIAVESVLRATSETTLRAGGGATLTTAFAATQTTAQYGQFAVPDMDVTDLKLSTWLTIGGSTNAPTSEFVYLQGFAA